MKEGVEVANRRMFSMDVVGTDVFLEMPITARYLYFHLGMCADDDGFVSSPRQIIRVTNCSNDDMKILVSKGYVIPFESGIIVIRHWKQNNYLRPDRYKKTVYAEEKQQLEIKDNVYNVPLTGIPCGIPMVNPGKDSIGKYRIDKNSINTISSELKAPEPELSGVLLPLVDKTDYDIPLFKIEKWKEAYPAVDIRQELHKMAAWLDSNPKRKKTRRGIDRFINTWLSREQDKGGVYRNGSRQQDQRTQATGTYELSKEYQDMYSQLKDRQSSPGAPF